MKKGFTVFELLFLLVAVILIAVITVPLSLELIDMRTTSALKEVKSNYEHAAIKYMTINKDFLPKEVGDTHEVRYMDLKNANMLIEIVDKLNVT